jgi:hypothetical protein
MSRDHALSSSAPGPSHLSVTCTVTKTEKLPTVVLHASLLSPARPRRGCAPWAHHHVPEWALGTSLPFSDRRASCRSPIHPPANHPPLTRASLDPTLPVPSRPKHAGLSTSAGSTYTMTPVPVNTLTWHYAGRIVRLGAAGSSGVSASLQLSGRVADISRK